MLESESGEIDSNLKPNIFSDFANNNGIGTQLSAAQYFVMHLFEEWVEPYIFDQIKLPSNSVLAAIFILLLR